MGKLLQGILGGVSGKIGNVVGSSWKGIPVIKAKPLSVANPRTAGQVEQRSKMSNIVAFSKPLLSTLIKPLWDRFASQMSGYNAFIAENIDLFENEMPSPASDLVISSGKMSPTAITSFSVDTGAEFVSVEWKNDSGEGLKLVSDEAYVLVVNETKKETIISSAEVARENAAITPVPVPEGWSVNDVCHVYLAFRRADGTVVSDTAYDTTTVI